MLNGNESGHGIINRITNPVRDAIRLSMFKPKEYQETTLNRLAGLPTSSGTFYPDFVAELDDGRALVVEYKGEHLIQYDQEKNGGELWASKSGGKALFLWAIKKDAAGRDVPRQLADLIGGRA